MHLPSENPTTNGATISRTVRTAHDAALVPTNDAANDTTIEVSGPHVRALACARMSVASVAQCSARMGVTSIAPAWVSRV